MGKRLTFYLVAIVFFFVSIALTYGEIFNYALFLASYPSHWLSYLFLGTVLLNCMLFIALIPLFKMHDKRINRAVVGILILLCILLAILLPFNYYWTPFIFAFYYSFLFPSLTIISYNLATDCFSIREFKQYSTRFRAAGTVGIILSASSVSFLNGFFGHQSILFLTIVALCVIETVLFLITPSTPAPQTKHHDKIQVWNFPLVRALLPMVTFMALGYYFSDYLFKFKLSQELNRQEIAEYLSGFICALNVVSFFTQMFLTQMAINRYGVVSLFYIAPSIITIGIIITIFFPSLIAFTLYSFVVSIAYWSFHLIAFEMALAPLPLPIRLATKTLEGGVLEFIGQGITALFFIAAAYFTYNEEMTLILAAVFTSAYALPWYYLIHQAKKLYKQALKNSIRLRGFSPEESLDTSHKISKEDLAEDLSSKSISKYSPFGFSLILDSPSIHPSENESKQLQKEDFKAYLNYQRLKNEDHKASTDYLIDHLHTETEALAIKEIVHQLSSSHEESTLAYAKGILDEELSPKQVYLTSIVFTYGELDVVIKGLKILEDALYHYDETIRLAAAHVFGSLTIGNPVRELNILLQDIDLGVVKEAIQAVANRNVVELIPSIAHYLGNKDLSHVSSKALQQFNEAALPMLKSIIYDEDKLVLSLAAIKTIAHLSGKHTEDAIIRLAKHPSAIFRTRMAYWALVTASSLKRSDSYLKQVYHLIYQEANLRSKLKNGLKLQLPSYLHKEIKIKLHLCSLRCLYWFGSYVDPQTVIQLISPLKNIDFGPPLQPERFHSTLELLNSLTTNPTLQKLISEWENESGTITLEGLMNLDPYLNKMIAYYEQREESMDDTLKKLIALREVSLFEKLSADVLFVIAEEAEWCQMESGEQLFLEGDAPNGLYVIVNGIVCITAGNKELSRLKDGAFFGEISLIDNSPRLATATAETKGLLLHIDQITFDDLINEFPDVLRTITSKIIQYLQNPPKTF